MSEYIVLVNDVCSNIVALKMVGCAYNFMVNGINSMLEQFHMDAHSSYNDDS